MQIHMEFLLKGMNIKQFKFVWYYIPTWQNISKAQNGKNLNCFIYWSMVKQILKSVSIEGK